jgi:hypothetical protein
MRSSLWVLEYQSEFDRWSVADAIARHEIVPADASDLHGSWPVGLAGAELIDWLLMQLSGGGESRIRVFDETCVVVGYFGDRDEMADRGRFHVILNVEKGGKHDPS